jgi:hypothetical protein
VVPLGLQLACPARRSVRRMVVGAWYDLTHSDVRRFKWHEEGRGIMRLLAKNVVESAVSDPAL